MKSCRPEVFEAVIGSVKAIDVALAAWAFIRRVTSQLPFDGEDERVATVLADPQ